MNDQAGSVSWKDLLAIGHAMVGMVHVGALPGTADHTASVSSIVDTAVREARILEQAGFDAIIIENMHDAPYVQGARLGPEITAVMTAVAVAVRAAIDVPIGVQVLSGGNTNALAVAQAAGGGFIRCENFVFSHVADEGLLTEAEAGPLLRYRRSIGADHIGVFCDIKKKHASHAITQDVSITDAVQAAAFFRADAVIITGGQTGQPTSLEDVRKAADASSLPVLVGSGVSAESVGPLVEHADALIVGSELKRDGLWSNEVDPERAAAIISARDQITASRA